MFMEQAIHASLKDGAHIVDEDLEFNRALQQVLKDSKVDFEIE